MKLNSIQFLRAVAAIMVAYAHSIDLTGTFAKSKQDTYQYWSKIGCAGVDLFFVISGFIITLIASRYTGAKQGIQFLKKRFFRINPLYYIASLLYLGVTVLRYWSAGVTYAKTPEDWIDAIIDTIFIIPLSGPGIDYKAFLMIGWTLAFEWLFYLLFFMVILSRAKKKIVLLSAIILALVALRYIFPLVDFRKTFITNPMMLEFLSGVLICRIYQICKTIPTIIPALLIFAGIGWFVCVIFFNYENIWEILPIFGNGILSLKRFFLWGIPSAFIMAGCLFFENNGKGNSLWGKKLILLGDASYAIYLMHMSIYGLLEVLYRKTGFWLNPDFSIIVQWVLAVYVGVLFYKWVEKPLLHHLQKPAIPPGQPAMG